jgi:putative tryptophan/tyrosine transport system substrate-binding protein
MTATCRRTRSAISAGRRPLLAGAATWPLAARAQQPALPVVGFLRSGSADSNARYVAAFRKGLNETGYVEGQNVTVEYHWLEGQYAVRVAVLVNPANVSTAEGTLRDVQQAAPTIGLHIQILNAGTIREIDAAFATFARERPDALFVAGDPFFLDRRVQFATLTARDRIPTAYAVRELVAAGGLMSYGTDLADMFHQVGVYTGSILKGAKPAGLPVLQLTKFEFVINLQTARALGIEVPPGVLSIADEVIE